MRIGRREIAVRILDESAGGFAIESDEDPGCQIGDTRLLEIALAWVEVRVVNVERQVSTPENPQDIVDPTPTRLGLLRIRDVKERDVYPLLSWTRFRSKLIPLMRMGRSFPSTAAIIVAIVAAAITLVWLAKNSVPLVNAILAAAHDAGSRPPVGNQPFAPDQSYRKSSNSTPAKTLPLFEFKTADRSEPDKTKSTQSPLAPKPKVEVPEKAIHLAHSDFLLKPEVIRLLSLRQEQQEELRKLSEEHRATADAASPKRGADGAQDADDSLIRLRQKSLAVLTEEQRQLLTKLHAEMESSQN